MLKKNYFTNFDWIRPSILALIIILIFSPIIYTKFHTPKIFSETEYGLHVGWAAQMAEGKGPIPAFIIAHPVFQYLLILTHAVLGISFKAAAFLITVGSILLMAVILYFWLKPVLLAKELPLWAGIGIVVGLNLVTPVSILEPLDQKFYLGYLGMITYHNPTIILLRPFAIIQFFYAVHCLQVPVSAWKHVLLTGILTVVTTLIKPSFAICILPAMGLLGISQLLRKQPLNWRVLMIGFALPSAIVLLWQYLVTYQARDGSRVLFYPFAVMDAFSNYLLLKLILSILFPLLISIIFFKEARRDGRMVLAWLAFLFGAFYSYFIAEAGPRFQDGNFGWSGEISLLVLFYVSTVFFLERTAVGKRKEMLLRASWVLHLIFGIIYYLYCLTTRTFV